MLIASVVLFALPPISFEARLDHEKQQFAYAVGGSADKVHVDMAPHSWESLLM